MTLTPMPRYVCLICCYSTPMIAYIANVLTGYIHCTQGVPGAPKRTDCPLFERAPGADDEWPIDKRGEFPTRYPVIEAG